MMLVRRNNSMNWLNNWFDDDFFNTDWMPSFQVNTTEPAVNVKEDDKQYTMEVAVPGLKKEFVRVDVNNDGELSVAIENKMEHKEDNQRMRRRNIICAVSSRTLIISRTTCFRMMSTVRRLPQRSTMVSLRLLSRRLSPIRMLRRTSAASTSLNIFHSYIIGVASEWQPFFCYVHVHL